MDVIRSLYSGLLRVGARRVIEAQSSRRSHPRARIDLGVADKPRTRHFPNQTPPDAPAQTPPASTTRALQRLGQCPPDTDFPPS